VAEIHSFDVDPAFVEMTRTKVDELHLGKVRQVLRLTDEETMRLPFSVRRLRPRGGHRRDRASGAARTLSLRRRVLPRAGAGRPHRDLDTPNRAFPLEDALVGLPGIQWLPARLAFGYARLLPAIRGATFEDFDRHGAWRKRVPARVPASSGRASLVDVTEEAGYGWPLFRETARSRTRRALLPVFALACAALQAPASRLAGPALLQPDIPEGRYAPMTWTVISRFRGPSNSAKMIDWKRPSVSSPLLRPMATERPEQRGSAGASGRCPARSPRIGGRRGDSRGAPAPASRRAPSGRR